MISNRTHGYNLHWGPANPSYGPGTKVDWQQTERKENSIDGVSEHLKVDWQQTERKENSIDGVSEHLKVDWLPTGTKENRTDEVSEHLRSMLRYTLKLILQRMNNVVRILEVQD
ncbi:hypothetical protein ROHU_009151 [Labeo rohita]|uniref:Uncharacterized protein n=1 Tax=Labeo rohita TaxID=84645 RepID=A0A498M465_LABRO|nr:hypothetical protein ROHU_009151 [Labeo rohita]